MFLELQLPPERIVQMSSSGTMKVKEKSRGTLKVWADEIKKTDDIVKF